MAKGKHVLVFKDDHLSIMTTAHLLADEFKEKAKAAGLKINKRWKQHNIPGQKEAVHFILRYPADTAEYREIYVDRLIQQAREAQGVQ